MFKSFINLLFPNCCPACDNALTNPKDFICTFCRFHLPKTNFHPHKINPVSKKFDGRINVHSATSFLYYIKGGLSQGLIWNLKYNGRKDVGIYLGELYGYDLMETDLYNTVDVIIPIPLHKDKYRKRGYNQSEQFAEGLSKTMNKPTDFSTTVKTISTTTQTTKRRYERWKNVENKFVVNDLELFRGKHILLVDDVVTTGSTLEAAAIALAMVQDIKISIATIACA